LGNSFLCSELLASDQFERKSTKTWSEINMEHTSIENRQGLAVSHRAFLTGALAMSAVGITVVWSGTCVSRQKSEQHNQPRHHERGNSKRISVNR
jgi:hypothetical protein